ncbi:class I glutamine amidotransferase-like protein [Xylaria bambusicola]|uniref:class I glutamine amidotransferase-like protein n=1 Tax=Xylaria bambusicola TaxID=326684 RepID=UPI002007B84E|nr:class I glutamine amidotransferase-like protein [Xylaria bambusicola]KAI0506162.1 class I glutamine amidotransferase-like protein [Xylaria bambusicola]
MSALAEKPPTKYGVVVFPGFQALDVFGPVDALNNYSQTAPLEFALLAATMDPVSTKLAQPGAIGQSVVPTHTFDDCPDLEVLLVPGGVGNRDPAVRAPIVEFLKRIYPKLRFLLTVCTGSVIVAESGLLDGRRATSNKRSWDWAISQGPNVQWVRQARWVVDGNIWTSSGVSAGIDLMFAFIKDQYGEETSKRLADKAEYVRNPDSGVDPFA